MQELIKTIAEEKENGKTIAENEKAYNVYCHIVDERKKYNEIKTYIVQ
jgi:hypothetical protein